LFPEYHPESSIDYSAEVGLTYPLSENLVFRTTTGLRTPVDEMKASPLIKDAGKTSVFFNTSISYVFGD
jgi:outer membrane protein